MPATSIAKIIVKFLLIIRYTDQRDCLCTYVIQRHQPEGVDYLELQFHMYKQLLYIYINHVLHVIHNLTKSMYIILVICQLTYL